MIRGWLRHGGYRPRRAQVGPSICDGRSLGINIQENKENIPLPTKKMDPLNDSVTTRGPSLEVGWMFADQMRTRQ